MKYQGYEYRPSRDIDPHDDSYKIVHDVYGPDGQWVGELDAPARIYARMIDLVGFVHLQQQKAA